MASQVIVSRFKIRKSADRDEFEKEIAAAVSRQKQAGATRIGQLSAYRLLRGDTAATERTYLLELEGLMSIPAGIADAVGAASVGTVSQDSYDRVRGR